MARATQSDLMMAGCQRESEKVDELSLLGLPEIRHVLHMVKPPAHLVQLFLGGGRQVDDDRRYGEKHGQIGNANRLADQIRAREQVGVQLLMCAQAQNENTIDRI